MDYERLKDRREVEAYIEEEEKKTEKIVWSIFIQGKVFNLFSYSLLSNLSILM